MAEELEMNVKSNIESVTKETQDWAKSLKEVNKQIEIQEKVITDLDKDLIKLKEQQDAIPKGAPGWNKLNKKIEETNKTINEEKNALKELNVEQKEASTEVEKFTEAQKEQDAAAKESIESFTFMGVSLGGVKAAFGKIIPTAKAMFGSIKAGLISTGIGAFIILISSVVSYFTNTKKGAEQLQKAFRTFGAAVAVLTDRFSGLGEMIVGAFRNPKQAIADLWEALKKNIVNRITGVIDQFKALGKVIKSAVNLDWDGVTEGAKDFGNALVQVTTGMDEVQRKNFVDGLKDIGKEIKEEVTATMQLVDAQHRLADSQRALNVETAQAVAEVEKLKLIAEDVTKSYEEREEAAVAAFAKEKELEDARIKLAEENLRLKEIEVGMGESLAEDFDELAEAEIALANVRQEAAGRQISLQNFLNGLRLTEQAEIQAAKDKKEADAAEELAKEMEAAKVLKALRDENLLAEIDNLKERALKKLEIDYNAQLKELEQHANFLELKEELDKKYARDREEVSKEGAISEVKWADMSSEEQLNIASSTAGSLATILGEETEAGKAMAIVQATIDTYASAQSAFKAMSGIPVVGPALGGIAAAAAVASGMKNVQAIASAGGGGGGVTAPATTTTETPAPQMMSGDFDLTGGTQPEAFKTYVVTDEMSSSQAQLANIRRRATI